MERSWPTSASVSVLVVWPTLAKTEFVQNGFDCLCVVCLCVLCVCVFVFVCVCAVLVSWCGFHVWVLVSRFWFGHVRCPRTILPRTALPRTALSLDRPKFRSFFPLPPQNSFFSSLSGGLVEFWWCLKR